jgi:hypothetical protein
MKTRLNLNGRPRVAPVKAAGRIVLVMTILFLLYLQGRKKTSDELDADYIPNDEEVNRNMPNNLNFIASKIMFIYERPLIVSIYRFQMKRRKRMHVLHETRRMLRCLNHLLHRSGNEGDEILIR